MVPRLSPLAVKMTLPFSSILVDLIMGLPDSHGYDSVMVVVDHGLTKGVIYCPCTKNIDTAEVAKLFFAHVCPRSSLHSKVISDRRTQFALAFTQELPHLLQYDIALCLSPSDGWGNQTSKPGTGNLPEAVRDASPTQTYSFLPASWADDTHEETDVLPIGN